MVMSGARCRLAYGPADATATHSLASAKSRLVFTFLVLTHPGSPGQSTVKCVCVCVWLRFDGIMVMSVWFYFFGPLCTYSAKIKNEIKGAVCPRAHTEQQPKETTQACTPLRNMAPHYQLSKAESE